MKPRRDPRPRGRPRNRPTPHHKDPKERKEGPETGTRNRTGTRTTLRDEIREKQAARPVTVDDLEHGNADVPVHVLAKGNVIKRYVQCGKEGCSCMRGGKRHGPYYYLVITVPASQRGPKAPRQKWFYLTKEEADRFRTRIRNFRILTNSMFGDLWEELNAR